LRFFHFRPRTFSCAFYRLYQSVLALFPPWPSPLFKPFKGQAQQREKKMREIIARRGTNTNERGCTAENGTNSQAPLSAERTRTNDYDA